MHRRGWLVVFAGLSLASSALRAQTGARTSRTVRPGSTPSDTATTLADPTTTERSGRSAVSSAPVIAHGTPRSFQVITVPVPSVLPSNRDVDYDILATGIAPILGRREGTIAPVKGQRAVVITVGIPSRAEAGRATVARVRFRVPGEPEVDVPVELDVTAVRRIGVAVAQGLKGARPGDLIELRFHVSNLGNAPDTVQLQFDLPRGWRVQGRLPRLALAPGGGVDHRVSIRIPDETSTGSQFVQMAATDDDGETATTSAMVEVIDVFRETGSTSGPLLTTGIATTGGTVALHLTANGPVANNVQMSALFSPAPKLDARDTRGLGRVGYYTGSPYLQFTAPTWQLGLGTTGGTISDVAGVNVFGRGGSFSFHDPNWMGQAIAALPGEQSRSGSLLAAGLGHSIHDTSTWIGANLSHLEDDGFFDRQLDAVSGMMTTRAPYGLSLTGELGERHFGTESGIGWSTLIGQRGVHSNAQLRMVHTPGGSNAFARATDELYGSFGRTLGRMSLSGSGWRTSDATQDLTKISSDGFAFSPRVRLAGALDLGVEVRSTSFDASGSSGSFGSAEHSLEGSADYRRGVLYANVAVQGSTVERSTQPAGGEAIVVTAPRLVTRSALGHSSKHGLFEAGMWLEENGHGAGLLPRQAVFSLRADHVALPKGLFFAAGLQRYTWFGDRAALNIVHSAVTAELPASLSLTFDVERNPLYRALGGEWSMAVKLERASRLPRFGLGATGGVVFEDINRNGRRDAGEPGFAGAIVRRGAETVVSDREGRYRFNGTSRGPTSLDPRSLPFGWLEGGDTRSASVRDIPLVATARVEVTLAQRPRDDGTVAVSDLSSATLVARDATGRTWVARVEPSGLAVFDALPAGTYELELDLSTIAEPLHVEGTLPKITVSSDRMAPHATIYLRPRPVRIRRDFTPGRAPQEKTPAAVAPVEAPAVATAQPVMPVPTAEPVEAAAIAEQVAPAPTAQAAVTQPETPAVASAEPSLSPVDVARFVVPIRIEPVLLTLTPERPTASPFVERYVVRKNDTMKRLANRFLLDEDRWPMLYHLNRSTIRNPDVLQIGQPLRVISVRPVPKAPHLRGPAGSGK